MRIKRITFGESSGLSLTTVSPEPLQLTAALSTDDVRVGEQFEVSVRAESRDDGIGAVAIAVEADPRFARAVGSTRHELEALTGRVERAFRFEALRSGPGQIAVLGSSERNDAVALVDLFVLSARSSRAGPLALVALAGAAPLALGALIVFARSRRRRP